MEPAIKSLKQRAEGKIIASSYTLIFPSKQDLEEFIEFMEALGVDFITKIIKEGKEGIIVELMKLKETHDIYSKMLETGYSPLD